MSQRTACRSCGGLLETTFCNFGMQPLSNGFLTKPECYEHNFRVPSDPTYPLCAMVCGDCKLVQLNYDVPREQIFNDQYAYFSEANQSKHWEKYASMAVGRFGLDHRSVVVEIASNDGYLLKHFKRAGCSVMGFEPSESVAAIARYNHIPTRVEFFGCTSKLVPSQPFADLVIANNVLAHCPDPNDLVAGIRNILSAYGVCTIEVPHVLELIRKNEFDTIYHEHYSYFSLLALDKLFRRHRLKIYDVERLPVHGGSLRLFIRHACGVPHYSREVELLREEEYNAGLHDSRVYEAFQRQAYVIRNDLRRILDHARIERKSVCGYGAPAKGNTLLNFIADSPGLGPLPLRCIADTTSWKQGKMTPGTHIPIVSEEEMFEMQPSYVLLLSWNWRDVILPKLERIKAWGGKVIIPIPEVQIL